MNAMLVYVMAAEGIFAGFINGWYYDDPHNTLVSFQVTYRVLFLVYWLNSGTDLVSYLLVLWLYC